MKSKKVVRNLPNPVARGFPPTYDPSFKRLVVLYAEQKSNCDARKRYGISVETIRRWRRLKDEIMEQAQQCIRRSQRHAAGQENLSDSSWQRECEGNSSKEENELPSFDLDSMPLQQRLSQNLKDIPSTSHSNISPLHSLPLSPTKLKVTRQGKSVGPPNPVPTSVPSQICLKWNSHHANMQSAFPSLLTREQYVDVTLVSEGKTLKCHRMILSSCSSYFEEILNGIMPFQHPVLFMKDIPFWALKALCDFMYAGEVHIGQDKLADLLAAANSLKIKGLATSIQKNADSATAMPEIKREINVTPPPRSLERVIKFEKDDCFFTTEKSELIRVVKRKDDRRYSPRNAPIAKDKDKVDEYLKSSVSNKVAIGSKVTVRKIDKAIQKPLTARNSYPLKKATETNSRTNRQKWDSMSSKETTKEVHLRKDNISDPLDLLQPVYEEIAKDIEPAGLSPAKLKDKQGCFSMRRNLAKRVKKRKHTEERESPPSQYLSRKGTRSRPNVKIPKFFDSHYEERAQHTTEATIVREPHTNHNDPLIEVAEIKAEPLDVEEAAIEMEENLDNYIDHDPEMVSQEGEEIIGNYDSPLVNFSGEPKANTPDMFKKNRQPLIINIHTVSETDERLLGKVKIVDIAQISSTTRGDEETIIGDDNFEAIDTAPGTETSQIVISNVQSMAEVVDDSVPIKEHEDAIPSDREGENATDPLAAQESETEGAQDQGVSSLGSSETKIEMGRINSQDEITVGCGNEGNVLDSERQENVTNTFEENRMDVVDLHQEVADSTSAATKGRGEETTCEGTQDHPNTNRMLSAENVTQQFLGTFEGFSESSEPTESREYICHDNQQTSRGNFHFEEEVASTSADTTTCNNSAMYKVEEFTKGEEFEHLSSSHFKLYNFESNDLSGFNRGLENMEEESAYIGLTEVTEEPDVLSGFEGDDVVMKDAADSPNIANYDSEQTLEKIVNDLNETLYDMGSK
ncbi:uncharacterized protein [Euwallacea fornicatus]|uniref:uncharacterized protein isoform X2 n=1 Tax=Euwallacea fornicatus TaxID=995702 RepID=UPI0033900B6E